MKFRTHLLFLLVNSNFFVFAQGIDSVLPELTLSKIALINRTVSYVTFPLDIGNIEPLMFEANVSPSFIIRERQDSKLMAVLTPQIVIRMYNQESYPVRTPSYIPQVSFYYLTKQNKVNKTLSIFAKIAHHSNGQDGSFYNEDGSVNLLTGNFSTNYFELGVIKASYNARLKAIKVLKSSIEIHPKSWMLEELENSYSGFRWLNSFTAIKIPFGNDKSSQSPLFSLKLETILMLDQYNNLDLFEPERINGGLTIYYHPKFLEDIGFFVQFYHGMDYYNINYQHQLDVIRFGIMTEIIHF
jgi:hypothetical protein